MYNLFVSNVDTMLVNSKYLSVISWRVGEGMLRDPISFITKAEHIVGITEGKSLSALTYDLRTDYIEH